MKTVKQQAYELVNKFQSKQHALTCVGVIIDLIKEEQPRKFQESLINWWNQVMVEINKAK